MFFCNQFIFQFKKLTLRRLDHGCSIDFTVKFVHRCRRT